MKKLLLLSVLFVAVVSMSFKPEEEEVEKYPTLELGAQMPMKGYVMMNVNGDKYELGNAKREKGTLVVFSCNTCPFVIQWEDRYPEIEQIAKATGVEFILVNSNAAKREGDDSFEAMKEHAEAQNYTMPYLVDESSKLANAFGAKTTPHVFLFNADGVLVYKGAIDDNSKSRNEVKEWYLNTALKQLASGREITTPESAAKGCSIKRLK
ncbi:MAG: thioredoxin family protein [Chitinophagales bacterium]